MGSTQYAELRSCVSTRVNRIYMVGVGSYRVSIKVGSGSIRYTEPTCIPRTGKYSRALSCRALSLPDDQSINTSINKYINTSIHKYLQFHDVHSSKSTIQMRLKF